MLFYYYLFLSLFLILHVKTEVNDAGRSGANSRQSIVLEGEHCQYIDFATARTLGSGCVDGTKMVIRNRRGHRKQFLIADSKTIYAFVQAGGKKFATDCTSGYTDRTCEIQCKPVPGLETISLRRSRRKEVRPNVYHGEACDWIDLNKVNTDGVSSYVAGVGCGSGFKFVVKPGTGVRRQFLFVEGKTILAFVGRRNKFADCSRYTEVTSQVECRAVANLGSVTLPASCGGSSEGILSVGGYGVDLNGQGRSSRRVEIFNPQSGRSCSIGSLPAPATQFLSLCGNLACGGYIPGSRQSCSRFEGVGGLLTALPETLREMRAEHLCWQLQSGEVFLLGGWFSGARSTTEKLHPDGSSSTAGFDLDYDISGACGIELAGNFIVTGGLFSKRTVAEITLSGQVTHLANLHEGRYRHACSKFQDSNGGTTLLVTGGWGGIHETAETYLDSTEILRLTGTNPQWSTVARLPTPRSGLTAVTVQNTVYVLGGSDDSGYFDTILRYNPSPDTWTEAGKLTEQKHGHASNTVADISQINANINVNDNICV